MALAIEKLHNVFYVKGTIDYLSSHFFKKYIELQLFKYQNIVIEINQVQKIDRLGMDTLALLYRFSLEKKKDLKFIGYGCKEIYDELLNAA